jgi:hypothetical protein
MLGSCAEILIPQPVLKHAAGTARRELILSHRVPSRPRLDPLASALTAPKSPASVRYSYRPGQSVHVQVGSVTASLTRRDDRADAVLPHIAQGHGRARLFARSHRARSS